MPPNDTVRCSYQGTCTARAADGMVPYFQAEYCVDCDLYYCRRHAHRSPTAIQSQYCNGCGVYHPRCWRMEDNMCLNERRRLSGYSDRYREPSMLFTGLPGSHKLAYGSRYIGFEIEAEDGESLSIPNSFGITTDGSLGSGGIEVLTPPMRGEDLANGVTEVMDIMRGSGWQTGPRTGLHTHIDMRDHRHDMRFLSRLFALGFAVEDVLFSLQKLDRHTNHYSIPLRKEYPFFAMRGSMATDFDYAYYEVSKDRVGRREIRYARHQKYHGKRYLGFNFHSVFFRGTLECRIHEGTLDAEEALNWADLLQSIVARAEKRISFKELINLMEETDRTKKIRKMVRLFGLRDEQEHYLFMNLRQNLVHIPYQLTDIPDHYGY